MMGQVQLGKKVKHLLKNWMIYQPAHLGELILHCLQHFLTTTAVIHCIVNMDFTVSVDVCNKAVPVNGCMG